jgi:hypothetical protein
VTTRSAVRPLAARSGRGQRLLADGLRERHRLGGRDPLAERRVLRGVPGLRVAQSRILENEAPDELGSVACGDERDKRTERVTDEDGGLLRDLAQDP